MGAEESAVEQAPENTGARLRAAREAAGLGLSALAAITRIRETHLKALEEGDFGALPGRTYVVGFARSYARALGLDEGAIVRDIRQEFEGSMAPPEIVIPTFTPGDPARVPSSRFAWIAAVAVLLVILAGFFFWRSYYSPAASLPSLLPSETPSAAPAKAGPAKPAPTPSAHAPVPAAAPTGPVVFTATEPGIWVKFYDAAGKQLLQKQMVQGETYTVPADARGPMLWTGRPDALAITIGGKDMPRLSTVERIMKDVPVSPAELAARVAPQAAPQVAPSVVPSGHGALLTPADRAVDPAPMHPRRVRVTGAGKLPVAGASLVPVSGGAASGAAANGDGARPSTMPSAMPSTISQ